MNQSEVDEPLAEIVIWCWKDNKQQIVKKELFKRNESKQNISLIAQGVNDFHFIIRPIKKRKLAEDLCAPLDFLASSDAFTISVGDQTFVVSAHRLMQISPVFRAMLTDEMSEKASRKVEVKDADPDDFRAFLEVIDSDQNVQPNPYNVLGVLMLADRYQVNFAKDRCEQHLLNCVEFPLFERFQLANASGFHKIQDWFLTIGSENLRVLYKANADKFKQFQFSMEFMHDLTARICDNK